MTSVRRMVFIAMAITLVFVQEQLLTFLPNIQLTTLLLVLFVSVLTFKESTVLIFVYVILDSLYMGAFNPFYMTPMFMGWMCIPLLYHTVLSHTTNEVKLAFFGIAFGFIYGWMFIPFNMIQYGVHILWPYLVADLPFNILMATANFFTILWLYKPLYKVVSEEMEALEQVFVPIKKNH